jgi:hypothetical protein
MSEYPIQGKLRIRPANFESDAQFIREHAGELSEPELRSMPGYDYLKFWYADFACTVEQWAALAPELDKRNILATLYEAPLYYAEALAEEQKQAGGKRARSTPRVLNYAALLLAFVAAVLFLSSAIEGTACAVAGAVALLFLAAGPVLTLVRGSWPCGARR